MTKYIYCAIDKDGKIQQAYLRTDKYLKNAVRYHNSCSYNKDNAWRVAKFKLVEEERYDP